MKNTKVKYFGSKPKLKVGIKCGLMEYDYETNSKVKNFESQPGKIVQMDKANDDANVLIRFCEICDCFSKGEYDSLR